MFLNDVKLLQFITQIVKPAFISAVTCLYWPLSDPSKRLIYVILIFSATTCLTQSAVTLFLYEIFILTFNNGNFYVFNNQNIIMMKNICIQYRGQNENWNSFAPKIAQ